MIKIVLGKKSNVERRGMIAKNIPDRKVDIYYVLESDSLQYMVSTYEKVEDETDRTLEIEGEHYKSISYENTRYFNSIPNAIAGYLNMRQRQPDKDITNILELYKYLEELKKEAEKLYNLHKNTK